MQSVATRTRVNQLTILVGVAFIFYQCMNWVEGIWVPISTIVVAAPFSTFLSFEKARNRFLGTFVGLLIASCLEYYLRFNPGQLPEVVIMLSFIVGFMVTKDYKFFVILITICTCMGFTYMNMPFTSFEPLSFLVARGMGVFAGIVLFLFMQKFVFGTSNSKLELLEEAVGALNRLNTSLENYFNSKDVFTAFQSSADIATSIKDLKSYTATSTFIFGEAFVPEVAFSKKVLMLNSRAIRLLIDENEVNEEKLKKLSNVVQQELNRC